MATNWIDKTCNETVWLTPEKVLIPTRKYFNGPIPLDPATEPSNPTEATKFFTEKDNGLIKRWDSSVFVNPPYGKVLREWCAKFGEESSRGAEIIALLPCGSGRPGTIYWQNNILQKHLNAICFIKGRLSFKRADGTVVKNNTYPSQILGFNVDVERFTTCFGSLGKVLLTKVVN